MMQTAQPPLEFIAPRYSGGITRLVHWAIPLWMHGTTDVRQVKVTNLDQLITCYQQFEQRKIRLLLAFRHPSVNDPIVIGYLFSRLMPQRAKQLGIALPTPIHAHFMYDRGVPLWTGEIMGWLFSKLGGSSIRRGKLDRAGLRSARHLLTQGSLPFMAAPEGATNGHSELIAPLEPGVAQLAFWGIEDLTKADRQEQVVILPIGLQYQYQDAPWGKVEALLTELEDQVGIQHPDRVTRSKL